MTKTDAQKQACEKIRERCAQLRGGGAHTLFERAALAFIGTRASPATRTVYWRDLARWLVHCEECGADPAHPTLEGAGSFRTALEASAAALVVRRVLAVLASIYHQLKEQQVVEENPFTERLLPRPSATIYKRTDSVSPEDAERVIASAAADESSRGARDVALLRTLWTTGMRRVSLVSLRRNGFTETDSVAQLRFVIKGGAVVDAEIPTETAQALRAWLAVAPPSQWIFCTADGAHAMSLDMVTKVVMRCAKSVGLRLHPHQFRAAFITQALDAGVPLEQVRAAVHHQAISSTLRYDRGRRGAGVAARVAAFRAAKKPETP